MARDNLWDDVSPEAPCRICGRTDWCSRSKDGHVSICRRLDTGEGIHKIDSAGVDYWIYFNDGTRRNDHLYLSAPDPSSSSHSKADEKTLDKIYQALLHELPIKPEHRSALLARGLSEEQIDRNGYRSLSTNRASIASKILNTFGSDVCSGIPGFIQKSRDSETFWSLAGPSGLFIPVRNKDGLIIALKIRPDGALPMGKYCYFSSKKHGGPGPGAPIHFPLRDPESNPILEVRLTEGELKADVTAALSDTYTISLPGVCSWRSFLNLIAAFFLHRILLAFDADFKTNPNVTRALIRTIAAIEKKTTIDVNMETWPLEKAKGIDDLLAAGFKPTLLDGIAAKREIIQIAETMNLVVEPRWRGKVALDDLEQAEKPSEFLIQIMRNERKLNDLSIAFSLERGPFEAALKLLEKRGVKVRDIKTLRCAVSASAKQKQAEKPLKTCVDDSDETVLCFINDRGTFWIKRTEKGEEIHEHLANFRARITTEITYDNGIDAQLFYEIEAVLQNKQPAKFRIPSKQFSSLGWTAEFLGAQALVYPGYSLRDKLRAAIQHLSSDNLQNRIIYQHLGWRKIKGQWIFLHAEGAIGLNGPLPDVAVEVNRDLLLYQFPPPPSGDSLKKSVRSSLHMLRAVSETIGYALLSATYRAPLGKPCPLTIYLVGTSGLGKTELLALCQQHFGPGMVAKKLPGSWSSTANSLEALAFEAKDALLAIDDLAPDGTRQDLEEKKRKLARLVRAQGNQAGRQRMNADGSLQTTKFPRGLIFSTGEDFAGGYSVTARMFIIEQRPGDLDWDELTQCQKEAVEGRYAESMSGYIQWLALHYDDIHDRPPDELIQFRKDATQSKQHKRVAENVAELALGLRYFIAFAEDIGALSQEEAEAHWQKGWEALMRLATAQAEYQTATDPAKRFVELISSALSSGSAHLAAPNGGPPENPIAFGWRKDVQGDPYAMGFRIGWVDGEDLYLDRDASYRAVTQMISGADDNFSISSRKLSKTLYEKGYLKSTELDRKHITVRRMLSGKRVEVLHLSTSLLLSSELAQLAHHHDNNPNPLNNNDKETDLLGQSSEKPAHELAHNHPPDDPDRSIGPIGPVLEEGTSNLSPPSAPSPDTQDDSEEKPA